MSQDIDRMMLKDLLGRVDVIEATGDLSCMVSSIEYDSRKVKQGSLFVALPGERVDGSVYIEDAVMRGAAAVVSESPCALGGSFPCAQVENARLTLAKLAVGFYGSPSEKLCTIGVTGTNGKTTIAFMLREILKAAGRRTGLLGTVRYEIGGRVLPAVRTTPESPDIQSMFLQMIRSGCDSVVMEVSSHALSQHRVYGICFDVGIFTNLTQDHLDYHGTLTDYFKVKSKLFKQVYGSSVINVDTPWGKRLMEEASTGSKRISYGFEREAVVRGSNPQTGADGCRMDVESPWGNTSVSLKLIGRFNLSNALAAFAAAASIGIPVQTIRDALEEMDGVPGRMESVGKAGKTRVFVDYAHTDDALSNVLKALREITQDRLIVVFGCGGNRDQGKRRLMGVVASNLADYSIITNDNPRQEIPEKIAADIAAGFDSERKYEIVLDRRSAIQRGIELAGKKDVLLIAGKGHETVQEVGGAIFPFDDRETVREVL